MQRQKIKELTLRLPEDLIEKATSKEIIRMLADKALGKLEYYKSKREMFENKYKKDFAAFKSVSEKSNTENFSEFDDMIMWEGFDLAYREWEHKYSELKGCLE
jgi:hypothetical protein